MIVNILFIFAVISFNWLWSGYAAAGGIWWIAIINALLAATAMYAVWDDWSRLTYWDNP